MPDHYATVLVAVMNNPRDLAIVRDQHWYRIPVDRVPRRGLHAPILAFYQTGAFGDEKWSVNYYAAALSWELFIIIVGFTITQFVISRRWVYYEQ